MKNLLSFVAFVLMVGGAYAQSNLPACQGRNITVWSNCAGSATFNDGNRYVGEFKDGKLNGQGTYTFTNGNKYVGEYKDDKRNGQGTQYDANGSISNEGIWADGNFVRENKP